MTEQTFKLGWGNRAKALAEEQERLRQLQLLREQGLLPDSPAAASEHAGEHRQIPPGGAHGQQHLCLDHTHASLSVSAASASAAASLAPSLSLSSSLAVPYAIPAAPNAISVPLYSTSAASSRGIGSYLGGGSSAASAARSLSSSSLAGSASSSVGGHTHGAFAAVGSLSTAPVSVPLGGIAIKGGRQGSASTAQQQQLSTSSNAHGGHMLGTSFSSTASSPSRRHLSMSLPPARIREFGDSPFITGTQSTVFSR